MEKVEVEPRTFYVLIQCTFQCIGSTVKITLTNNWDLLLLMYKLSSIVGLHWGRTPGLYRTVIVWRSPALDLAKTRRERTSRADILLAGVLRMYKLGLSWKLLQPGEARLVGGVNFAMFLNEQGFRHGDITCSLFFNLIN